MTIALVDRAFDDALASASTYADQDAFHATLARLRHGDPVHWTEPAGFRPFWAITRHADIMEIEKQADLFINAPRTALRSIEAETEIARHTGSVQPISSLAWAFIDRLEQSNGACDFASDIAVWFPLYVIMLILGVPEEDAGLMLKFTQQHFANTDPLVIKDGKVEAGQAARELFEYFDRLTEERRRNPRNDIISLLADAAVDG